MAREIAAAAREHPRRVTIVLTGNIHSRIADGASFDSTFAPTGAPLRALLPGRGGVPSHAIAFPGPDPRHYDGAYGVDSLRASPPAVP